ncbi:hypothetical protein GFS31_21660 [Leptolyngbya sp. BL0902]|nr:hypothetical protein GFS31_21660 [Leptolyngbya sp. BL0902]
MPWSTVLMLALGGGLAATAQAEVDLGPETGPDASSSLQAQNQPLVLPFTDVPSDHWAYQALLNLAGVYGCVGGYPDGTFRGENAVTRYEFAAGMDACLGALNTLLQSQHGQRQSLETFRQALEQDLQDLRSLDNTLDTLSP